MLRQHVLQGGLGLSSEMWIACGHGELCICRSGYARSCRDILERLQQDAGMGLMY